MNIHDLENVEVSIGTAAKLLGVAHCTLRRWEKRGILQPVRTGGKHRRYVVSDLLPLAETLHQIRTLRDQIDPGIRIDL